VTGIRQDTFANANRIKVEEPKGDGERGKYLYPPAGEPRVHAAAKPAKMKNRR
jgi:hypothetical protein